MRPGVRKFLAVLGVVLVFVLGMIAGAAVTLRIVRHRAEALLTEHGSDLAVERIARYVSKQVHADTTQREQIAVILRSAHGEMREVRREITPRVRDIYERSVARIRVILRADQSGRFDELVSKGAARLRLNDPVSPAPSPVATVAPAPPAN